MLLLTAAVCTSVITLTGCACAHYGGPSDPVYKASNLRVEGSACLDARPIDVDRGCSGTGEYSVNVYNACSETLMLRVGPKDLGIVERHESDGGTRAGESLYRTESGESCTPASFAREDADSPLSPNDAAQTQSADTGADAQLEGSALADTGSDASNDAGAGPDCKLVALVVPPGSYAAVYSAAPNPSGAERAMFGTLGANTEVVVRWTAE